MSAFKRKPQFMGLLLLNGVLLGALALVTLGPSVDAQVRPRGDYTMIAGGANGIDAHAVYIVDTINEEMVAISYDPSSKQLIGVGYRNLAADGVRMARQR